MLALEHGFCGIAPERRRGGHRLRGAHRRQARPPAPQRRSSSPPSRMPRLARFPNSSTASRPCRASSRRLGPKGTVSRGIFYLQKPGKMRFEYASPNPFVIVSDGNWVTIKNRSKDKADQYPLSQTPLASGALRPQSISRRKRRSSSVEDTDSSITVTLEDRKNIVPGQLILVYDKSSNALQQWVVVDGKGRRTTVALQNMVAGCRSGSGTLQDRRQARHHPGQEERPLDSSVERLARAITLALQLVIARALNSSARLSI